MLFQEKNNSFLDEIKNGIGESTSLKKKRTRRKEETWKEFMLRSFSRVFRRLSLFLRVATGNHKKSEVITTNQKNYFFTRHNTKKYSRLSLVSTLFLFFPPEINEENRWKKIRTMCASGARKIYWSKED